MHNLVYFIGRLTQNPELVRKEDGKRILNIHIAVQRTYKNEDGIYETDFIPIELENHIAEKTVEYCKKGDLVGLKGRLETRNDDGSLVVVVDKISFLATGYTEGEDE